MAGASLRGNVLAVRRRGLMVSVEVLKGLVEVGDLVDLDEEEGPASVSGGVEDVIIRAVAFFFLFCY